MGWKRGLIGIGLALAMSADARADAVCLVDVQGTGTGTARCLGSIGKWTVDPSPVRAEAAGGRLVFYPRRLVSFDPDPAMTFSGRWSAVGGLVSGEGVIEGSRIPFAGTVRTAAGGTQMEIVLGRERRHATREARIPSDGRDQGRRPRRASSGVRVR
jgi:hypothetical protein